MNRKYLLIALVALFAVYSAWMFFTAVTPYVSVRAAKESGAQAQVKGLLDKNAAPPHQEGEYFVFFLLDEDTGENMSVKYRGTKPDQFDQAHHIVAVGRYKDEAFFANKLLIKCPSKYEAERK